MMRFTFPKSERLKSRKLISQVFAQGKKKAAYPLLLFYLPLETSDSTVKIAFSVPKKRVRSAVKRNRIKRLMREAWRLHKHQITKKMPQAHAFVLLYIGENENPAFRQMEKAMKGMVERLVFSVER